MEVLKHPQSIKMSEGMLHIHDVEGPKKTRSVETRLEAMEQQVFKCQGMVERGLYANHMMITEFTSNHKMDAVDIGKHLSRLYDRVDQLQGQIYDLQNQNYEYEYRLKAIRKVFWCGCEFIAFTTYNIFTNVESIFPTFKAMHSLPYYIGKKDMEEDY
ncbi:40S ribosomal protein S5-1 [Hordeum vulgare]|nr:40S ribosomal protein S5-1 [Hordeum vulgare]